MEHRKIGSLSVSIAGLGCNNFGWRIDESETKSVVDAALDAGINFFDTADIYGGTKSEEFLGRVLAGRRDKMVLATKFGMPIDDERKGGAKPEYLRQALDDSLRRLATDHVDLYQLHRPDAEVPIADTLGALDELVKAGKIREIGCSNFSAEQLREAEAAVQPGAARFVSVQNHYSLINRDDENEAFPEVNRQGLAYLPFFPLASGLLSGKYRKGQPVPEGTRLQTAMGKDLLTESNLDIVEALIKFAESRGHTILELAFSWLAANPAVASVIAGATSAEQVRTNATAASWKLSAAELDEIRGIVGQ